MTDIEVKYYNRIRNITSILQIPGEFISSQNIDFPVLLGSEFYDLEKLIDNIKLFDTYLMKK